MMVRRGGFRRGVALGLVLGVGWAGAALAQTVVQATVRATDVVYAAGTQASVAQGAGGSVPGGVIRLADTITGISFPSVTGSMSCLSHLGCISLNLDNGDNLNNPDGMHAQVKTSENDGSGSISGLKAPGAGFLVGVFIAAGGPSGPVPKARNFEPDDRTGYAQLYPVLDQVFFIGDGLTGDNTGSRQVVHVPAGATELVLGISDACGYNGPPSCYYDNTGSYTVKVKLMSHPH